jgi:hypothetical protein
MTYLENGPRRVRMNAQLRSSFSRKYIANGAALLACLILIGLRVTAAKAEDTSAASGGTKPPKAVTKTADTTGATTPLVASEVVAGSTLHIYSHCDPSTGALSGDVSTRQFLTTGGQITVYYDTNFLKTVKIAEKERHTRLYEDLQTVVSSLNAEDKCSPITVSKTLQFKRSVVTITGVDKSGSDAAAVSVVTGPTEHAYLGLDLPVTNRKDLKYDTASKSLQPASASPQLYLSLNLLYGDILSPPQSALSKQIDNFSLKFFISANSTPLNSYGTGIGYRLPGFDIGGFNLSSLSLFGGYFWSKQDALNGSGVVKVNGSTNGGWRFGVTYDVSTLIKSVKW